MPRNMSFMLTTNQIWFQKKTVTRRLGWWFLRPGDVLWACEKCQGLKRGEKIKRIGLIKVVGTLAEPLNIIDWVECVMEGFPEMRPDQFIEMFCKHNRCEPDTTVNRIEVDYL